MNVELKYRIYRGEEEKVSILSSDEERYAEEKNRPLRGWMEIQQVSERRLEGIEDSVVTFHPILNERWKY